MSIKKTQKRRRGGVGGDRDRCGGSRKDEEDADMLQHFNLTNDSAVGRILRRDSGAMKRIRRRRHGHGKESEQEKEEEKTPSISDGIVIEKLDSSSSSASKSKSKSNGTGIIVSQQRPTKAAIMGIMTVKMNSRSRSPSSRSSSKKTKKNIKLRTEKFQL